MSAASYLRWLRDVKGVDRITVQELARVSAKREDDMLLILAAEGVAVDYPTHTVALRDLLAYLEERAAPRNKT